MDSLNSYKIIKGKYNNLWKGLMKMKNILNKKFIRCNNEVIKNQMRLNIRLLIKKRQELHEYKKCINIYLRNLNDLGSEVDKLISDYGDTYDIDVAWYKPWLL